MTAVARLEHALPGLFSAHAPRPRVRSGMARLERLASLMDDAVPLPGTSYRFGVDSVIGLLPGVGDGLMGLLQGWIVFEAARLGVPRAVLAKMVGNVAIDTLIGTIPIAGSVFDFFFHASRRNVRLALEALAR